MSLDDSDEWELETSLMIHIGPAQLPQKNHAFKLCTIDF